MLKAQRFNFTYREFGKRSRRGSYKITIINTNIDKQITLKRDYIYKIENTDLEIGVSGVLLRILFYFEARRCSSVCVTHQPFEYNDPKDIAAEVVVHL